MTRNNCATRVAAASHAHNPRGNATLAAITAQSGKATGNFPSGHRAGTPFAPGANPENGLDSHGMVASMLSVGKLDYHDALDGISLTNTITPSGLGRTKEEQVSNLVGILDAGFVPDDECIFEPQN